MRYVKGSLKKSYSTEKSCAVFFLLGAVARLPVACRLGYHSNVPNRGCGLWSSRSSSGSHSCPLLSSLGLSCRVQASSIWLLLQIGAPFCGRPYSKGPILVGGLYKAPESWKLPDRSCGFLCSFRGREPSPKALLVALEASSNITLHMDQDIPTTRTEPKPKPEFPMRNSRTLLIRIVGHLDALQWTCNQT